MDRKEIFRRIQRSISSKFDIDINEITEESSFIGDLGIDLFKVVLFMLSLEDLFGIPYIEIKDRVRMKTVKDVVDYVEEWKKGELSYIQ